MSQQSTPRSYGRMASDVTHRLHVSCPSNDPASEGGLVHGRTASDVTHRLHVPCPSNDPASDVHKGGLVGRRADLTMRRKGDVYDVGVAGILTPRELTHEQQQALGRGPPCGARDNVGRVRSDVTRPQNQGATAIPATKYPAHEQQSQPAGWHGRAKSSLAPGPGAAGDLIAFDYKQSIAHNLNQRHHSGSPTRQHQDAHRRYDAASPTGSYEVAMAAAEARSGSSTPRDGQGGGARSPMGFRSCDYKQVLSQYEEHTGDVSVPNFGRRKNEKHGKVLTNMYGFS